MPIEDLASSRLKYAELGSYGRDFCTILNKWDFKEPVTQTLTKELDDLFSLLIHILLLTKKSFPLTHLKTGLIAEFLSLFPHWPAIFYLVSY